MHLARGRFALRHRASSISRPSVDSCLRSDRIRLMDASSLGAKRDGDGGKGGVQRRVVLHIRQYVRLYFYLLRILKSRETHSPPPFCSALKCDKPVTPHYEERAFGYSSVYVVKRGRSWGLVQQPTVPDVDGSRHPEARIVLLICSLPHRGVSCIRTCI